MKIETLISRIRNAEKNIYNTKGQLAKYELKKNVLNAKAEESKTTSNQVAITKLESDIMSLKRRIRNYEMQLKQYVSKLKIAKQKEKRYENIPDSLILFMNKWEKDNYKQYKTKCEEYKLEYKKEYDVNFKNLQKLTFKERDGRGNYKIVDVYTVSEIEDLINGCKNDIKNGTDFYRSMLKEKIFAFKFNEWRENQPKHIINLIERTFDRCTQEIDYDKLKSILEMQKRERIRDFIDKIVSVSGEIIDTTDLKFNHLTNEISGIVKGSKCSVHISTIISGGYNIQNQHYRIKIDEIDG